MTYDVAIPEEDKGQYSRKAKHVSRDESGYGLYLQFENAPKNLKELEAVLEGLKHAGKLNEFRLEPTDKYYGVSFYAPEGPALTAGIDANVREAAELVDDFF